MASPSQSLLSTSPAPQVVYPVPCRLEDSIEDYLLEQPSEEVVDAQRGMASFGMHHLREHLPLEVEEDLREDRGEERPGPGSVSSFPWLTEEGNLKIPNTPWSFQEQKPRKKPPMPQPATSAMPKARAGHQPRMRAGKKKRQPAQEREVAQMRRLLARHLSYAEVFRGKAFSVTSNGSRTKTGWNGARPPPYARKVISDLFRSGRIGEAIKNFAQISYNPLLEHPTLLIDLEERLFIVRTSVQKWLRARAKELMAAMYELFRTALKGREQAARCSAGVRGEHLACIFGHARQYIQKPALTAWHRDNEEACNAFLRTPIMTSIISWANSLLRLYFPGVAKRYEECVDWHRRTYGINAQFGLFFQLCVNSMAPGQSRVHCAPHADSKNVIGICLMIIYEDPDRPFDHKRCSWLVVWEPAVAIQLPPWVALMYPSSLFLHFNIDMKDVKFVSAPEGEEPTPENSEEMTGSDGRGSIVFFNQGSLFQSSETDSASLKEACGSGKRTTTDYGSDAQAAFKKYGTLTPMPSST